jgi:hypothetical protein
MPGWILMHHEALRGLDCEGVPLGYVERARPKGNEVRRERQPGMGYCSKRLRSSWRSSRRNSFPTFDFGSMSRNSM